MVISALKADRMILFFCHHSTELQLTQLHLTGAFTALNDLVENLRQALK